MSRSQIPITLECHGLKVQDKQKNKNLTKNKSFLGCHNHFLIHTHTCLKRFEGSLMALQQTENHF